MKRKRYTDEQIAYALQQAEAGTPIKEVCRKLGVSETMPGESWKLGESTTIPKDPTAHWAIELLRSSPRAGYRRPRNTEN